MAEIVTRIVTIAPQLRSAKSVYMGPLCEGIWKRAIVTRNRFLEQISCHNREIFRTCKMYVNRVLRRVAEKGVLHPI